MAETLFPDLDSSNNHVGGIGTQSFRGSVILTAYDDLGCLTMCDAYAPDMIDKLIVLLKRQAARARAGESDKLDNEMLYALRNNDLGGLTTGEITDADFTPEGDERITKRLFPNLAGMMDDEE